jgi:hypothetical protein
MMNRTFLTTLFVVVIAMPIMAQFSVNTEIRPRGEYRNGYKSLFSDDDKAACFISQRTRLGLQYKHEKYSMNITAQDVRVWGDESVYNATSVKGDDASVELFEAWLQVKLGTYSSIRAGRQQWSYDDQRLLSARNWGQTGIAYDGILFNYDHNDIRLDIGLSLNNNTENKTGNAYTPDKMKFLDFIYLSKQFGPISIVTFTGIVNGYQSKENSETIYVTATYGPYFKVSNNELELEGSVFHQFGTNQNSESISAYLLSLKGLYSLSDQFKLGPGFDIISGNNASDNSEKDHSFDILYGGRHRFSGEMDYFTDLTKSVSDAGLVDFYAKAQLKINTKNSFNFAYHYFTTHQKAMGPDNLENQLDKSLGSEIDLMYRYKADIPVDLRIGLSLYKATKTMEILQGVADNPAKAQYFMYVQLAFKPEILNITH